MSRPTRPLTFRRFAWAAAVILLLAVAACACKNGKKSGGPVGPSGDAGVVSKGDPAECEKARPIVTKLYQGQVDALAKPDDSDAIRAGYAQTVSDNTEMVMVDCRTHPDRFAPCLQAAVSVEQMERDCLLPLDDEGTVEGKTFGGK